MSYACPTPWSQHNEQHMASYHPTRMHAKQKYVCVIIKHEVKITRYWPSCFFFPVFCLTVKVEVNKNAKKEKTNVANIKPRWPNKLYSQSTIFVWSRDFLLVGRTKVEKNPAVKIGLSWLLRLPTPDLLLNILSTCSTSQQKYWVANLGWTGVNIQFY